MPSYNSTARVPFKRGGSVKKSSSEFSSYNKIRDHIDREQKLQRRKEEMEMDRRKINQKKQGVMVAKGGPIKKPKVKRIILWKGKAKDWPGAKKAAERTKKAKGGIASESKKKQFKENQKKTKATTKKFLKGVADMYNPLTAAENIKSLGKKILSGPKRGKDRARAAIREYEAVGDKRDRKAKGGKAKDSVNEPGTHSWWLLNRNKRDKKAKGGKADKNWIQGVNKSIKKRGTKGVCTGKKFGSASCPPGSKRYNLAKTFKKMARAKHASGGLVRFI